MMILCFLAKMFVYLFDLTNFCNIFTNFEGSFKWPVIIIVYMYINNFPQHALSAKQNIWPVSTGRGCLRVELKWKSKLSAPQEAKLVVHLYVQGWYKKSPSVIVYMKINCFGTNSVLKCPYKMTPVDASMFRITVCQSISDCRICIFKTCRQAQISA